MKLGDKVVVHFEGVITKMERFTGYTGEDGDFISVKSVDSLPGGCSVATVNVVYVKKTEVEK